MVVISAHSDEARPCHHAPDLLTEMVRQQRELQRRLGYVYGEMTDEERVQHIKDMYVAAVKELGEALDEVTWKPWAQVDAQVHVTTFIAELNDAWQFICNMWFLAMPHARPDEVAQAMKMTLDTKLIINHRRADGGYDGTNKCRGCKAALDDPAVECYVDAVSGAWRCAKEGVLHLARRQDT